MGQNDFFFNLATSPYFCPLLWFSAVANIWFIPFFHPIFPNANQIWNRKASNYFFKSWALSIPNMIPTMFGPILNLLTFFLTSKNHSGAIAIYNTLLLLLLWNSGKKGSDWFFGHSAPLKMKLWVKLHFSPHGNKKKKKKSTLRVYL